MKSTVISLISAKHGVGNINRNIVGWLWKVLSKRLPHRVAKNPFFGGNQILCFVLLLMNLLIS